MATTLLATENSRPSLSQTIEDLYKTLHAGGAYDVKKNLVRKGEHNQLSSGIQSATHTPKGFKTKMQEQKTEFKMVNSGKDTTMMKTSIHGNHSTKKYWKM